MIKKILFCLTMLVSSLSLRAADGDWKIHPAFDNYFQQLFDAPDRLYIVAYGQIYLSGDGTYNEPKGELFVLDKSTGETLPYTNRNYLSGVIIAKAQYNPRAGYLCIVYSDGNIDLLYDDDRVVNIPALKNTTLMESKNVNAITFSLGDDLIYMATDFGFIAVDPEKRRIDKARNYHTKFNAIARVGSKLLISNKQNTCIQDYGKPLQSLSDFNVIPANQYIDLMVPLNGNQILTSQAWSVNVLKVNDDNTLSSVRQVSNDLNLPYYTAGKQGYVLSGSWALVSSDYDGNKIDCTPPIKSEWNKASITSSDFKTYYVADGREGIKSYDRDGLNAWETVFGNEKTYSRPNSPSVYLGAYMNYSDKYGLLTMNNGVNYIFSSMYSVPTLISGLRNGEWTNYGSIYCRPSFADSHRLARGIVQDPFNPDLFYSGSYTEGIRIVDFGNPDNVITLGTAGSTHSAIPGFVAIKEPFVSDNPNISQWTKEYINISIPAFDNEGNMWAATHQYANSNPLESILVWPATSIKNRNYKDFIQIKTGFTAQRDNIVLPLKHPSNKNLVIVFANTLYGGAILLLDHKGTIDNSSDDRELLISGLSNQDGGGISWTYVNCAYEDSNTGTVWFGTSTGVFTIQPSKMFDNPTQGRRIKVSRNDGTNMADYLLDGVDVHSITVDGNGNKWFATLGAGVVQTSSDGTHVMRQLTTDNSYLPSDKAFMAQYNPASNSMMFGTMNGLAEYFVPGASSGDNFDQVKIYPNPVRPDFVGNITIEGLLDNSLVKIVDSEGNLVKELGSPMDGVVRWNGTNLTGAYANSGVYFVLMSRQGEGANEASVGKIVIVK